MSADKKKKDNQSLEDLLNTFTEYEESKTTDITESVSSMIEESDDVKEALDIVVNNDEPLADGDKDILDSLKNDEVIAAVENEDASAEESVQSDNEDEDNGSKALKSKKKKGKNKKNSVTDNAALKDDADKSEKNEDKEAIDTKKKKDSPDKQKPAKKKDNKSKESVKNKDNKKDKKEKNKSEEKAPSSIRLVAVLGIICAVVALLLATVNHFTEDRIAKLAEEAMLDSIREVFDATVEAEKISLPENSNLSAAYLVKKNGGVCGYFASVLPSGFGGEINLAVGVDSTGKVLGVDIISMSETPGLGSRVDSDWFLSQFVGITSSVNISESVDAIAGATISSSAIKLGVQIVVSNPLDIAAMAEERGLEVVEYTRDEISETVMEEIPETAETVDTMETEPPVVTEMVTEAVPVAPDVSKDDVPPEIIVQNPDVDNVNIDVSYEEDTTGYETETTEAESTEEGAGSAETAEGAAE